MVSRVQMDSTIRNIKYTNRSRLKALEGFEGSIDVGVDNKVGRNYKI